VHFKFIIDTFICFIIIFFNFAFIVSSAILYEESKFFLNFLVPSFFSNLRQQFARTCPSCTSLWHPYDIELLLSI